MMRPRLNINRARKRLDTIVDKYGLRDAVNETEDFLTESGTPPSLERSVRAACAAALDVFKKYGIEATKRGRKARRLYPFSYQVIDEIYTVVLRKKPVCERFCNPANRIKQTIKTTKF